MSTFRYLEAEKNSLDLKYKIFIIGWRVFFHLVFEIKKSINKKRICGAYPFFVY